MSNSGLIQVALGKSAFQWSLLAKKGIQILVALEADHSYKNPNYGGSGAIKGMVKIGATPCKRLVRLYDAKTGILIRETWAAGDGSYTFPGLRTDIDFTVTGTDYTGAYNDVIAARVRAV